MEATQQTDTSKAIRKNFTMPCKTAHELDFLAESLRKKQSQIIQDLIHKASEELRNEMRLAQLKELKGVFTGQLGAQTIQSMKSDRIE